MALRSQTTVATAVVIVAALAQAGFAQNALRYEVRHEHWLRDGSGTLVIDQRGVSYQETSKNKRKKPERLHHDQLNYEDIQQLYISPQKLTVVTYRDQVWRLGMDKEYEFTLPTGETFAAAYAFLKKRLDERLVAALADDEVQPLWELPVKRLGALRGSEGALVVGAEHIVYRTERREQSRTWRFQDIENISSAGRFDLTITTYERAKAHYGSMKEFHFQLKQPLDERRFEALWRRLNRSKGLSILTSLEERNQVGK